ncbi:MAG: hexitol phosphatase HxpB [Chitinophagaceae bacterium]|nr:hexitol phosphatase HxpB [Chitinophagaceae bacterium]
MNYKAVIFDMDGLLIDSEPLWREAGKETLALFGKNLTTEQYKTSTGLRTEEWVEHWFRFFDIDMVHATEATQTIIRKATEKIDVQGCLMEGALQVLQVVRNLSLPIGLATSSPLSLVETVLKKLGDANPFDAITSAEFLPYGKPHPQVYLDCAEALGVEPFECIAFEDSFNGMIAAKAARMKCIVVPAQEEFNQKKWYAADLIFKSLNDFGENEVKGLLIN